MARFVWLTVLCWALSAPWRLHAEARPSEYDVALEAALDAHARGDLPSARTSMERAHALSPNARTLRGLAIIAHAQARHVEAVLLCDEALASETQALTPLLRQSVEELRTRSLRAVARVTLTLVPADASLRVDEQPARRARDGTLLLAPGAHRLVVSAPGYTPYEIALAARAGQAAAVHVALAPASADEPRAPERVELADPRLAPVDPHRDERAPERVIMPTPLLSPIAPPSSHDPWWTPRRRNLTLALGGVGALGGAALLIVAARKFARVDDDCGATAAGACTHAEAEERIEEARVRSYARAGGVLIGVGGATLLTALALELWTRRSGEHLTLGLTPSRAILQTSF